MGCTRFFFMWRVRITPRRTVAMMMATAYCRIKCLSDPAISERVMSERTKQWTVLSEIATGMPLVHIQPYASVLLVS